MSFFFITLSFCAIWFVANQTKPTATYTVRGLNFQEKVSDSNDANENFKVFIRDAYSGNEIYSSGR